MRNQRDFALTIYQIIGAAMDVHTELGYGLLEPIYNEALVMELEARNIKVRAEESLPCYYKNQLMKKTYRMDLVVEDIIIVELKSVTELCKAHREQLFNYLRLTKKTIGLLINFGEEHLVAERYAYDEESNKCFMVDRNLKPIPPLQVDNI